MGDLKQLPTTPEGWQEYFAAAKAPGVCQKCMGYGQIANDDDASPWPFWAAIPAPSNLAVTMGLVHPIECPRCKGTGSQPQPASHEEKGSRQ